MIEPYQNKPERKMTYAEKRKAGLVTAKKRSRLRPVATRKIGVQKRYVEWIRVVMPLQTHCAVCKRHTSQCGPLEPHHPFARANDNLFRVIPACHHCHHVEIHGKPLEAFKAGWLQPAARGLKDDPKHPIPWKTLLPPPQD